MAVRMSVLSKRWRDLYKFMPSISLSYHFMLSKMETFLSLYSGDKIPVIKVDFCCCRSCSSFLNNKLEHFYYYLEELGAEYLLLNFADGYSIPCNMLPRLPSLNLSECTLQPNLLSQFRNSSLQSLNLFRVTLLPDSLECVLLNCLGLNSLRIASCQCPPKLSISGPDLQLKKLIINNCHGFKDVEIYASNLLTLECYMNANGGMYEINYIFAHAPKLQTVFVDSDIETNRISRLFGTLANDLPQLKFLTVTCTTNHYQIRSAHIVIMRMGLRNLRRLAIYSTNLLTIAPILQSCPLLEKLHVDGCDIPKIDGARVGEDDIHLLELKRVKMSRFSGTENELAFCLYLLKRAVILEEMLICRCPMYYTGVGTWNEFIKYHPWSDDIYEAIQQLQHQALSPAAQLSILYAPP